MNIARLSRALDYNSPMTLCGCRCTDASFECCEYNVIVFDDTRTQEEIIVDDTIVLVHHDSISMPSSGLFTHIPQMRIISDESLSISPQISAIIKKHSQIFQHATKSCIVDAKIVLGIAKKSLDESLPSAPFWSKCAAYRLAEAILYYNAIEPSGAHMMTQLRNLPHSITNATLSTVYECLGLERATSSLLERMLKSTIGFLAMLGVSNLTTKSIDAKVHHLVDSSLVSDAYYYIGRTVCTALCKEYLLDNRIPDTQLYALKIAIDPNNNEQQTSSHIRLLDNAINEFMPHIGWALTDVS